MKSIEQSSFSPKMDIMPKVIFFFAGPMCPMSWVPSCSITMPLRSDWALLTGHCFMWVNQSTTQSTGNGLMVVYTIYKNGEKLGMVYYCFTNITYIQWTWMGDCGAAVVVPSGNDPGADMIQRFLRIHVVKPNHKQFLRLIATLLGGESHYVYIMLYIDIYIYIYVYIYICIYIYGRLVITGFTRLDPVWNQSVCLLKGLLIRRSFDFTAGRMLVFFYATKGHMLFFPQSASLCNERTLGPKSLRVFFFLDNESMPWSFLKRKNSNWVSMSKQSMAQWSISCLNPSHSRDVRTSIHFCTRLFQN